MPRETILILGGTREAAALAARLVAERPEARIITALAGRTKEPAPIAGEVRSGGFGGAVGLARFIAENAVTRLVDATHPFAERISANARKAAETTGVAFETLRRDPWPHRADDRWIEVDSLGAACIAMPAGARVFLAIGSQHLAAFAGRADVHFVVRMVDPPREEPPFEHYTVLVGKPGDIAAETALLRDHRITHLLCRNSGGPAGYGKIAAARALGLPVIIVSRPD